MMVGSHLLCFIFSCHATLILVSECPFSVYQATNGHLGVKYCETGLPATSHNALAHGSTSLIRSSSTPVSSMGPAFTRLPFPYEVESDSFNPSLFVSNTSKYLYLTYHYSFSAVNITQPFFKANSFMGFKRPNVKYFTKIYIRFKAAKLNGLLFYLAEKIDNSKGDFFAISLWNGFVQFL